MMAVGEGSERGPTDPDRLSVAVEAAVREEMARGEIPGMAVVLVHEGEVILSRGWGLADVAAERAVDPEETIFRFGSLSKLVTATAVMRLVEEGQLDLSASAEDFLGGLRLPGVRREPVRVHHLLTHTSGLDERIFGQYSKLDQPAKPLDDYLSSRSLAGRWPPGEVISYSDHGYALLGLIVEQASGERFERYVEGALFQPLGMVHASISPRLDPVHARRLARGYHAGAAGVEVRAEHVFNTYPSVAIAATPAELGRFLLLHLRRGAGPGGTRILDPGTVQAMHRTQASHHPAFDGRTYGFSFRRFGDHRALYHDGSTTGFTSRMVLVPESGFGFLLVYNHGFYGAGGSATRPGRFKSRFTDELMAALAPAPRPGPEPDSGPGSVGAAPPRQTIEIVDPVAPDFFGVYREVPSHSVQTLEKVNTLFGQRKLEGEGGALVLDGQPVDRVESDLFRTRRGELFSLRKSTGGEYLLMSENTAWVRVGWPERAEVQAAVAAFLALMFLAAAATGALSALRPGGGGSGGVIAWAVSLVGALNLVALVGIPMALYRADLHDLFFGPPLAVPFLAAFPLLAAVLAAGLGAALVRMPTYVAVPLSSWWVGMVAIAALAWLPWLHHWRLWSVWT